MVLTRNQKSNMEAVEEVINRKFQELKDELLVGLKASIDKYIEGKKEEFKLYVDNLTGDVDGTNSNNELQESIAVIQKRVAKLKSENDTLKKRVDDMGQYIRRPNLRISGVPLSENGQESAEDVRELVYRMTACDGDLNVPISSIDRAHRTGKIFTNTETKVKTRQIIVRFTSFRDRTAMYRSRKIIKEKSKYGISLVLTPERLGLLKEARTAVENISEIKFAYADINCYLRVLTSTGKHLPFDSISELHNILTDLE